MFTNELWNKPPAGATDFYTHQINHSVRMQMGAGSRLRRTPSSAGNRQTWAISMWVKRAKLGDEQFLFEAGASGNQDGRLRMVFTDGDAIMVGTGNANLATSTAVFRDPAAFYHIHWKNTGGTNTVHVNGQQVISVSCSGDTAVNNTVAHGLGCRGGSGDDTSSSLEGYISEFLLFDGTAYSYTDVTDEKNGVLIPADPSSLTFGTNGTWLKFQTAADLDDDSSGNTNDWTASNLATHDQMLDTPTFDSSSNGGNFATIGGLEKNTGGFTFSEGNLKYAVSTNQRGFIFSQGVPESGKYYWEVRVTQFGGTQDHVFIGVCEPDKMRGNLTGSRGGAQVSGAGGYTVDNYHGAAVLDGSTQSGDSIGTARSVPQTFGIAIDRDNNTFKWTYDGSTYSSTYTIPSSGVLAPYIGSGGGSNTASGVFNFGADSTFAGLISAGGNADGNGYGNFSLAVPSGYVALCAANLPTAEEVDPAETDDSYPQKVFNSVLYTGNGSSQSVTGVGFQPDFTWIKNRNSTQGHKLFDSTRGVTKMLNSGSDDAESTESGLSAFDSDGFSLGGSTVAGYNTSSNTYVAWNWKEGADYGFDVVAYNGTLTGSGVANISHSLGAIPEFIVQGSRNNATGFAVRHQGLTDGNYIMSNQQSMSGGSGTGWGTSGEGSKSGNGDMSVLGTSSTFTSNNTGTLNVNGYTHIAWLWRGIEGFSKFGSYVANGSSTDNAFVYLGFRPAIIITKGTRYGDGYNIHDNATSPFNLADTVLQPNSNNAELSNYNIDMLSNGFKVRDGDGDLGSNGVKYIYMAWAENPFKYATAR
tara:strand:- start:168 stop:2597 length:2430 start_codon:yes stop_codon:yes gene_type:complete